MKSFRTRNVFNRTAEWKGTAKMGQLIPVLTEEILPGDTYNVQSDMVIRLQALIAPIMHRIDATIHFFFVPTRLLQDDWETYIGGGKSGTEADSLVAPMINSGEKGFATSSLADYLEVPTGVPNLNVLAYPFRAYTKIWNEWYRNESVQDEASVSMAFGPDNLTNTTILRRCWQNDYFTNALFSAQRGPTVYLPLGQFAPVVGNGKAVHFYDGNSDLALAHTLRNPGGDNMSRLCGLHNATDIPAGSSTSSMVISGPEERALGLSGNSALSGMVADLSQATASSVNDIRWSFQVQRFFEKMARGGYRYVELLLSHFGVRSEDARLQRSEYLGGGKAPVVISEVLQTSSTDNTSPQGNMSGHGFSLGRSRGIRKTFKEHGYLLGILSVMPKSSYFQGLNRMYSRKTRFDYAWPVFSHLGEQAIANKELFAQSDAIVGSDGKPVNEGTFGFTPRFQEYRSKMSTVHGDFRNSLEFWTLVRDFSSLPTLSAQFVECNPSDRIFAVKDTDNLLIDVLHKIQAVRCLPKQGIPGLIDHD